MYEAPNPSFRRPATMNRNARNVLHQRRSSIGRRAKTTQAVEFFNVLTSPELLKTTESVLPEHRERLYPPSVGLSMFMRQVLEADGSCQKPVNGWAAQRAADGLSECSVGIGGYPRHAGHRCGRTVMFSWARVSILRRIGIWRRNRHQTLMPISASIGGKAKRRFRCAAG